MDKKITIVTHSSGFHTDDVFAVATLLLVLEKDHEVTVTRSRDMEVIEKGDYVVDVGGIYNPDTNRFDHHQEGGAGQRDNGIPYASFGLVWKEYGKKLCGNDIIAYKIDTMMVQPIDFIDVDKNGLKLLETGVKNLYPDLHPFDIGLIRLVFTPTWKEDLSGLDDRFLHLAQYAKELIQRTILYLNDNLEGESVVLEDFNSSENKKIVILSNGRYPWDETLSKTPEPIYAVYENITAGTWSLKCVRNSMFSYESRKNLPIAWAGKRNGELEKITGVKGAVFCHNNLFMAVAKTKEAILKLAELALNS